MDDSRREILKSVSSSKYDKEYFNGRYSQIEPGRISELESYDRIYKTSASLLELKKEDKVVDFGCGTGMMAIYLHIKFGCEVIGIDYSQDAIELAKENVREYDRVRGGADEVPIQLMVSDITNLPMFGNIKAVFLIDVVEHLYDEEIEALLEKIKGWCDKDIYIVIHTDNKLYQKIIRPIADFIQVILGKNSLKKIKEDKKVENERHVNLTTVRALEKKLSRHGFRVQQSKYPDINPEIIKSQIAALGIFRPLLYATLFLGKIFYFLLPSFYMSAKFEKK